MEFNHSLFGQFGISQDVLRTDSTPSGLNQGLVTVSVGFAYGYSDLTPPEFINPTILCDFYLRVLVKPAGFRYYSTLIFMFLK